MRLTVFHCQIEDYLGMIIMKQHTEVTNDTKRESIAIN